MESNIKIRQENISSTDAIALLNELACELEHITGSSGNASFDVADVSDPRARFVVARDSSGSAVGCGAIRPMEDNVAEIKRVYARVKHAGIGAAILRYLEQEAAAIGFRTLRLETRAINRSAVDFYLRSHYRIIPNFGKYVGHTEAICFEKTLISSDKTENSNAYETKSC